MSSSPDRIAAIDIGTNSVHMIVAERQGRGYRVVDKEKEMVQLGSGSLDGEPLQPDAIERAMTALGRMSEIARTLEVDQILAVATSAVREAPNRQEFLDRAGELGVEVRVISGEEEGDLIFEAVRGAVDFGDSTGLCVDIGGGSVELIVGTRREIFFVTSLPVGVLRLTERFLLTDPPTAKEIRSCRKFARKRLRKAFGSIASLGFDFTIGTSGTIETLASIASGDDEAPAVSLRWLDRKELGALFEDLSALAVDERVERYSIDRRRAQVIVAGAVVLEEILHELRIRDLRSCSAALREGLMARVFRESGDEGDPESGSVRRNGVIDLAEKSGFDRSHGWHVARLACSIFDQIEELHGLGGTEREILEYAALLHEIGLHVAYQRHHKHTYYLIRHASLDGFTSEHIAVLANVARYHRGARPKITHENFAELNPEQQNVVEKLAAILRLAEGLDRGRRSAVRSVEVRLGRKKVTMELRSHVELVVELDSAEKGSKLFTRVFGRRVVFEITSADETKRTRRTDRSGLSEARF